MRIDIVECLAMTSRLMQIAIVLVSIFDGASESELPVTSNNITAELPLRPAHLEGVPLERDGAVNVKYRRELLLAANDSPHDHRLHNANDHESESLKQVEEQIRQMFKIADVNVDGYLSREELRAQIENNIIQHLEEAERESRDVFQLVDENGDGRITWSEYKTYLKSLEINNSGAVGEDHSHEFHPRDLAQKKQLNSERALFERADAETDGLDDVEWLGLRHPEQSAVLRREMIEELLAAQDRNGDHRLTADEFVQNADSNNIKSDDKSFRRREFETLVDQDGDGYADEAELERYVDPRNPQRHADETDELIVLFDGNSDGQLSLDELLARADLLGASGFIHANLRLHNDL